MTLQEARLHVVLKVRLPTHNLRRTNGIHLGRPTRRGHNLAHSTDFIGRVAGDTDVVVALENDLDVADVELR